ncbi:MAG: hypothetical protein KDH09_08770 [Chrysiogenetes bacterium]|nr:hypothetical protein [Chrysiogenetes bacterium]
MLKSLSKQPPTAVVRGYVSAMMAIFGRALAAASQTDGVIREELKGFPDGYTFEMTTLPSGPGFQLRSTSDGCLEFAADGLSEKPTLSIQFKHLRHAYLVLAFQEGTARAFANDRMVVDGEIAHAMRMVRIFNRLEALILPAFIGKRAIKRYPTLEPGEKVRLAIDIYSKFIGNTLS